MKIKSQIQVAKDEHDRNDRAGWDAKIMDERTNEQTNSQIRNIVQDTLSNDEIQ